jgi:serine/threonine protein kinase
MTEQRAVPRAEPPPESEPEAIRGIPARSEEHQVTSARLAAGAAATATAPRPPARPGPPPPPPPAPTGALARAKRCPSCAELYPGDFRVCPRDATVLEVAPEQDDPLLGALLGDSYEVTRVIGEGGMGRVYEAQHKRLAGKRFAIKVLHADLARQPDVVSRFQREAEATSVLSHANIVGVVDVNRAPDGRPFIVAELLEGEMLASYIERKRCLSVPEAVYICRQVCAALMAAHERDIVHRDIKPENVFLIGREGDRRMVKVLDFGISRVGEGAATLTKTGMVMGTPAYMPPEQARGARVDHRADIYAVGAILYEAVTGKRPFDGPDLMATLARVLSEEPPRPCTLNAALPPALEMTIQRAMAKQPSERHRTMRELDAELASFDTSRPTERGGQSDESPTVPLDVVRVSSPSIDPGTSAQRARLHLVVLSSVAAAWLVGGTLDAATSGIRWLRGTLSLSPTELFLISASICGIAIAPSLAWVRYLKQRVWPSTPRSVELVDRLRAILVATLVTYAAASLMMRVVEAVAREDLYAVPWPGWPVFSFIGANTAGVATWYFARKRIRSAQAQR